MIFKVVSEAAENFKSKGTNPFLGTYVGVWLIRNWELIFTLFNFDSNSTLNSKVEIVKSFLPKDVDEFWCNVGENILLTFFVLVFTYIFLLMSKLIKELYESSNKRLVKLVDKNKVALKADYDLLQSRYDSLSTKYDKVKEDKLSLSDEMEKLEDRIIRLNKYQDDYEALKNEYDTINGLSKMNLYNHEQLKSDVRDLYGLMKDGNFDILKRHLENVAKKHEVASIEITPPAVTPPGLTKNEVLRYNEEALEKLLKKYTSPRLKADFITVAKKILRYADVDEAVYRSEIDTYLKDELLYYKEDASVGRKHKLTDLGKAFYEELLNEK